MLEASPICTICKKLFLCCGFVEVGSDMRRRSTGRDEDLEELQRRRQLQEEQLMKVIQSCILFIRTNVNVMAQFSYHILHIIIISYSQLNSGLGQLILKEEMMEKERSSSRYESSVNSCKQQN